MLLFPIIWALSHPQLNDVPSLKKQEITRGQKQWNAHVIKANPKGLNFSTKEEFLSLKMLETL